MPHDEPPRDLPPLATPEDVKAVDDKVIRLRADFEAYKLHTHGATPPPPPPPPPPDPTLPQLGDAPAGKAVDAATLGQEILAAANGAVLRVRPGTILAKTLPTKTGVRVWPLDVANPPLFDGAGVQWFISGAVAPDMEWAYLRFKNYYPAIPTWTNVFGDNYRRNGGINGDSIPNSHLYRLEGFECGRAIGMGNGMHVDECWLHHNHQVHAGGWRKTGWKITGGKWHDANRKPAGGMYYDWSWEAGATKFVECTNTLIEGVHSYKNNGPGIWYDINNDRAIIRRNRLEDNLASGIFWEVSFQAIIEENDCHRNGDAANIYVSNCAGKSVADPLHIRRNKTSGHRQWEIGLSNSGGRPPATNGGAYLNFVDVRDNIIDPSTTSAPIRQHTIGAPPAPTSIVVSDNKKSDGTPVVLTKSSQ